MNTKHLNSEKGQAIVYLAIGLVVFLGFVALAIDGGMVLADRRDAQNATDASALAGAAAAAHSLGGAFVNDCSSPLIGPAETAASNAAINRAGSNHYPEVINNDANNFVHVLCDKDSVGPYIKVSVGISKNTPTSFLQVLVPSINLTNKMTSTARLHTAGALGGGNTLIALGEIANSIDVGGNANLRIMGGGVFGNANADCDGSGKKEFIMVCDPSYPVSECTGTKEPPVLPSGAVNIVGTSTCSGQIHPAPVGNAPLMDPNQFDTPEPAACATHQYGTGHAAVPDPAPAGLYCVHGPLDVPLTGSNVTFYLYDGGFNINGGTYQLSARSVMDPAGSTNGEIPGLLFVSPLAINDGIRLNGNACGYFRGTWLLPGTNMSKWNGTFGAPKKCPAGITSEFRGMMVVKDFNMRGTFDAGMWYDTNYIPKTLASIDLLQ